MSTAVVVGSGPNGLAGAIRLAEAGLSVTLLEAGDSPGGGMRTSQLTLPGLRHDDCSAFHPALAASPYLTGLGLERHGLELLHPQIPLGHALDGGGAALLHRDVGRTVEGLGAPRWGSLLGPVARDFDALVEDLFRPVVHLPRHPSLLARFGLRALAPATVTAQRLGTDAAAALFGGIAAHLFARLDRPLSAAVGLMLGGAGHAHGWPVARGGSGAIADALVARLTELGGRVETGVRVTSYAEVAAADVVLLDLSPTAAARLLEGRQASAAARAYRRYRYGPAAWKVDLAVEGGVPWTNPDLRRAGTVHLGGTLAEVADAERLTAQGRMPRRPFMLVGQQYLADPDRSVGDTHPVWAYAHVPHGYDGDATDAVLAQVERFAPGFRDRVVATHVRSPREIEAYDANDVGGDISTGSNALWRVALRPRVVGNPYRTGAPGIYLCSAATPPGGGVHGMGGFHAAETALRDLR